MPVWLLCNNTSPTHIRNPTAATTSHDAHTGRTAATLCGICGGRSTHSLFSLSITLAKPFPLSLCLLCTAVKEGKTRKGVPSLLACTPPKHTLPREYYSNTSALRLDHHLPARPIPPWRTGEADEERRKPKNCVCSDLIRSAESGDTGSTNYSLLLQLKVVLAREHRCKREPQLLRLPPTSLCICLDCQVTEGIAATRPPSALPCCFDRGSIDDTRHKRSLEPALGLTAHPRCRQS